jgi:hypothetical protein
MRCPASSEKAYKQDAKSGHTRRMTDQRANRCTSTFISTRALRGTKDFEPAFFWQALLLPEYASKPQKFIYIRVL